MHSQHDVRDGKASPYFACYQATSTNSRPHDIGQVGQIPTCDAPSAQQSEAKAFETIASSHSGTNRCSSRTRNAGMAAALATNHELLCRVVHVVPMINQTGVSANNNSKLNSFSKSLCRAPPFRGTLLLTSVFSGVLETSLNVYSRLNYPSSKDGRLAYLTRASNSVMDSLHHYANRASNQALD